MRILKEMEIYLNHFRDTENVYYLNAEGRKLVGDNKVAKKTIQARHYLMRNEVYIAFQKPEYWRNEVKLGAKEVVTLVCDAFFQAGGRYYMLEVDHTQKMSVNRTKMEKYRMFRESGAFQKKHGYFPKLVWITTTEFRRKQLMKLCEGFEHIVYTIKDFK